MSAETISFEIQVECGRRRDGGKKSLEFRHRRGCGLAVVAIALGSAKTRGNIEASSPARITLNKWQCQKTGEKPASTEEESGQRSPRPYATMHKIPQVSHSLVPHLRRQLRRSHSCTLHHQPIIRRDLHNGSRRGVQHLPHKMLTQIRRASPSWTTTRRKSYGSSGSCTNARSPPLTARRPRLSPYALSSRRRLHVPT